MAFPTVLSERQTKGGAVPISHKTHGQRSRQPPQREKHTDFISLSLTETHRHPIIFLRQTDKRIALALHCQMDTGFHQPSQMDGHEDLGNLPRQRDPDSSPSIREAAGRKGPQAAGHTDKGTRLLWHQHGGGNLARAPEVPTGQP